MPLLLRGNFGASLYLIVLSAAHALAYYRRAEERERDALKLAADLHRARLDALRLQLQPHFLFNTLNAICAFVGRKPAQAEELIAALSGLLRTSLETHDDEVPLAREMTLLERYLTIEQSRLGRRLRVVRQVASGIDGALVPPLLLQPLAENAIQHGIEPRVEPGTLTIRVEREGEKLIMIIADDGIGLVPRERNRGESGIGLENTAARLRTLYGEQARCDIISPSGGGVHVVVVLPFHTEPLTKRFAVRPMRPERQTRTRHDSEGNDNRR
jgi:two-component system LytT family sensor kinase